jgi:V8-like Glu-specific endopeptidase
MNTDEKGIIMDEDLFLIDEEEFSNGVVHRSIGAMTYRNMNKQLGTGSGVLISENLVLTTAHNIYDRDKGSKYTEFRFYPGAHGDTDYYF